MKKIGIITLHGYHNYGNRLQNYAVQEVLKSLQFDAETIIIQDRKVNVSTADMIVSKIQKIFKRNLISTLKKICKEVSRIINYNK